MAILQLCLHSGKNIFESSSYWICNVICVRSWRNRLRVWTGEQELREREREFYLTPARPGFGHMAAWCYIWRKVPFKTSSVAKSTDTRPGINKYRLVKAIDSNYGTYIVALYVQNNQVLPNSRLPFFASTILFAVTPPKLHIFRLNNSVAGRLPILQTIWSPQGFPI